MTKRMKLKAVKAAIKAKDFVLLIDIQDYTGYALSTATKCYRWLLKNGYLVEDDGTEPRHCNVEKCETYLIYNK